MSPGYPISSYRFGDGLPLVLTGDGSAPPPTPGPRPRLLVYGDSYTASRGGEGPSGWLALVAAAHGLEPVNMAVSGSGYVQHSRGSTFPYAATTATLGAPPDAAVVIVAGTQNDRAQAPEAVRLAAVVTYATIRRANPTARLLVVGGHWPWDTEPPANVLAVRDVLREVAADHGAPFLDPLGEAWLHSAPGLIGPDGTHPSLAGQAVIAEHVAAALGELLAAEPVRSTGGS